MKGWVIFLLFFSSLQGWCQNFEGLIKYSVSEEGNYLGSGQNGTLTVIIKDKNFHMIGTDSKGAIVTNVFLNGNEDRIYMVLESEKTIYKMKISELPQKNPSSTERITRLLDTLNILGHTCNHYRLEDDDRVEDVWIAEGLTVMDIGYKNQWSIYGMNGLRMKSETVSTKSGRSSMEMTYFEAMTVDMRDFDMPKGFKIIEGFPFGN